MKNEKYLEFMTRLQKHEDFKVIYDGEDFGVYKYIEERDR